jgi:diacylglycerol kinase (ATP)
VKVALLVNYSANNNSAEKRWNMVKKEILSGFPAEPIVIAYNTPFDIEGCIQMLMNDQGVDCFVSVGGDGSMNWILNALMNRKPAGDTAILLGAVGLGSSNDFLKPVMTRIKGIPVKINVNNPVAADVGRVTFINQKDERITRYFIVNASIGVTAEANLLFNTGDFFLDKVKSVSVKTAILYAALKTIIRFRNKSVQVEYDGVARKMNITNISVVKNPNISGSFCYDQAILPGDGWLGLNYCHDMNHRELVSTLMDLSKEKFSGKKKRVSELVKQCKIETGEMLALETDGEVMLAKNIFFSIIPGAISIAGN